MSERLDVPIEARLRAAGWILSGRWWSHPHTMARVSVEFVRDEPENALRTCRAALSGSDDDALLAALS